MTTEAALREQLLTDYIKATQGKPINPDAHDVSPVPLAQDYIQFLAQRRLPIIIGNAREWAGKGVGRQLANLPLNTDTTTRTRIDAPPKSKPWAEFTPSPYVNPHRRHRSETWPIPGDLIVFDAGADSPFGTLGVFIHRDNDPHWFVYTQGPRPPAVLGIDTRVMVPLGWWRVTDHRLRLRDTGSVPITPHTAALPRQGAHRS